MGVADHHPVGVAQVPVGPDVLLVVLEGEVTEVTQLLQLPADGVTFGEGYSFRYD